MSVTLGLDLGPNSIGWALVDEENGQIVDTGSRIFPEGVDNFDTAKEKSRNEDRRTARGMRRQVARRARRKRVLRDALVEAGLWPRKREDQQDLLALDPYELRSRAVDPDQPALSRHELGRVLLHLNQRRGFLSNRKDQGKDKETEGMKAEISGLRGELEEAGQTLGQYLHDKQRVDPTRRNEDERVRNRHTERAMLEDELHAIAERHPELLTEKVMYGRRGRRPLKGREPVARRQGESMLEAFGVHGLIFFQRALYWPKSMIGLCELEPKQLRCPRSDRRAQRFRLLQEVKNLRFIDAATNREFALTEFPDARALLLDKLAQTEKATFVQIAKWLGRLPDLPAPEQMKFNLERGHRAHLKGHVTDVRLKKAVKRWFGLEEDVKTTAVEWLLDPARDDEAAAERLEHELGFTPAEADALLKVDLPAGYIELSRKALSEGKNGTGLLDAMETGLLYQAGEGVDDDGNPTDAIHAAGYLRRDELQRRVFDTLPDPARTPHAPIGDIPNPVVRRTLVELRKLVNAILREQRRQRDDPAWKPAAVHVEMARDVKQGERARREFSKRIREREAERDRAADKLREHKVRVTRDAINRYLLWEEQDYLCPYSGGPISFGQLFNGETDVDHVLPYSRCLDDSQMNKVVCFRRENQLKGQRSPHEWRADADPAAYERMCQRARNLPYPKYRRFLQKELELDKFIARQLVDASYIARVTAEYLRCLFDLDQQQSGAVLGLKGQLTAELRRQWGLNDLLSADGIDVKSRDDHRHHAVDAIVIALTHRSRLQELTRIRKAGGFVHTGQSVEYPWPSFREDAQRAVNNIRVSHRAARKVHGALHEDTIYGQNKDDAGRVVEGEFVVRKPLDALSANEVPLIRDPAVRKIVEQRLAEHGVEVGRGKKPTAAVMKQAFAQPLHLVGQKTGTVGPPIKKVRVVRKEQTIRPIRGGEQTAYVKPGSTHHVSLFRFEEKGKTKYEAVWTSMIEAADRLKQQAKRLAEARRQRERELKRKLKARDPELGKLMRQIALEVPLKTTTHPDRPEAEFVFSLSRGEMVLAKIDGREELLIYNTSSSTQGQIQFHHHTDARPKSGPDQEKIRAKIFFKANTLFNKGQAQKVTVDYLGRIRWAND
ncbi:MAG: type II CRISPR RNA-guided endonuclease Cas9 [Planctomycetota bacterium]